MTITEKQARELSGLLDVLDDLASLRKDLGKTGREFYICAQDKEECLNSVMTLPAETGIAFVEEISSGLRKKLVEYGVIPDAAPSI